MDPEERIELVQKVREFAPKEKLIIAGAACEGKLPYDERKSINFREISVCVYLYISFFSNSIQTCPLSQFCCETVSKH